MVDELTLLRMADWIYSSVDQPHPDLTGWSVVRKPRPISNIQNNNIAYNEGSGLEMAAFKNSDGEIVIAIAGT